jgi:hypothetical protein
MIRPIAEVLRGIDVPIHHSVAGLAGEVLGELRACEGPAATVMNLGRGKKAVCNDKVRPRALGLVVEYGRDAAKAGV